MLKNGYLKKSALGEEVYYGIADGTISTGTRINLREIEFAGLTLYNVDASIVHTASAPLLLGQSALAKLGTISMDLKNGTLSIDKGNANYDFANSNSYEFEYSVSVYDYAPIIEFPNMITSNTIGFAKNGFVNVLNKTNPNYYLIKSEDKVGYMWIGWMK